MLREDAAGIVEAMARTLAMYHAIFANEAIAQLGRERGTKLVRDVVSRFGRERGGRIRERALAKGEALTLDTMNANYDLPLSHAWKSVSVENGSDITYCPMWDEWKKMDMLEEGKLYCAVDAALADGFSESLSFARHATLMDGDECCRHRYRHIRPE